MTEPYGVLFLCTGNSARSILGEALINSLGKGAVSRLQGSDELRLRAFNRAFREMDARIKIVTSLRLEMLDRMALQRELDAIGKSRVQSGEVELFHGHVSPARR